MRIATIPRMEYNETSTKHQFRTTERLRDEFILLAISRLRSAVVKAGFVGSMTDEALQNALYVWLTEADLGDVAQSLVPLVRDFQGTWARVDPRDKNRRAGKSGDQDEAPATPTVGRARRKKARENGA